MLPIRGEHEKCRRDPVQKVEGGERKRDGVKRERRGCEEDSGQGERDGRKKEVLKRD